MSPVKDLLKAVEKSRKRLRQGMTPVDETKIRERAKSIVENLMLLALLRSTDPEKQAALERMHEHRIEIQDLLEIIVPGYLE